MFVQDKIADMLTRIRNANIMKYPTVEVMGTKMTLGIAEILKNEGYIEDYSYEKNTTGDKLTLKRISKSGLRVYAKSTEIPRVLNGLGIAIISTSKGLMTDKEARNAKLGGEVLAYIW